MKSLAYIHDLRSPGKRTKLRNEPTKPNIWNRRFQNLIREANIEQFKAQVNDYEEHDLLWIKLFISLPTMIC